MLDWMKAQRATLLKPTAHIIARDTIEKAVAMLEQGINPVLVLTSNTAVLTADFAVSIHLSRCHSIADSFMVVPIWRELSAFLNKVAVVHENLAIYPVSRVKRRIESGYDEFEVVVLASLEFEVQPESGRADGSNSK